jgi:hypothetical protein
MTNIDEVDAARYFAESLKVSGIPHLGPEKEGDPGLLGKRLGLLNGGSWIVPWANYFGRKYLPGVHLINIGNEAVQLNFMRAHHDGQPTPPQSNIDAFERYARDLVELGNVDAVLITCSTMNRSYPQVQEALAGYGVPVVQIDRPMMEAAVRHGGRVLVVATHGPTVASTQALLEETASEMGRDISFAGVTVHEAWERLAEGDVEGHNTLLAEAICQAQAAEGDIASVVLAQLSMTVFLLSYPDPQQTFGVPVFTSGQCGFEYVRELLMDGQQTE